ncbi:uncharacterized protein [Venturia canescens]|uniref:uncharacterized protein n=1 Tax=Venturia canescens TaxID=32260 RepID=UPI001C9C0838|nr:uncharacterized protein LOC122409520 [Venturia canescens]
MERHGSYVYHRNSNGMNDKNDNQQWSSLQENDRRLHQNLVMIMDRRLSNVQQAQFRYDTESHRGSQDATSLHSTLVGSNASTKSFNNRSNRENVNNGSHRSSHGSIVKQPRSSKHNNEQFIETNKHANKRGSYQRYFAGFTETYATINGEKRRRPTLWETLTGLVCSLGALATRAAKMAARRGDSI